MRFSKNKANNCVVSVIRLHLIHTLEQYSVLGWFGWIVDPEGKLVPAGVQALVDSSVFTHPEWLGTVVVPLLKQLPETFRE